MLKTQNPSTVAPPVAHYSHSVEAPPGARWLFLAGQVGIAPDGTLAEGFEAQHERIWQNTLAILADAGMGPEDIVRLKRRQDIRLVGLSTVVGDVVELGRLQTPVVNQRARVRLAGAEIAEDDT